MSRRGPAAAVDGDADRLAAPPGRTLPPARAASSADRTHQGHPPDRAFVEQGPPAMHGPCPRSDRPHPGRRPPNTNPRSGGLVRRPTRSTRKRGGAGAEPEAVARRRGQHRNRRSRKSRMPRSKGPGMVGLARRPPAERSSGRLLGRNAGGKRGQHPRATVAVAAGSRRSANSTCLALKPVERPRRVSRRRGGPRRTEAPGCGRALDGGGWHSSSDCGMTPAYIRPGEPGSPAHGPCPSPGRRARPIGQVHRLSIKAGPFSLRPLRRGEGHKLDAVVSASAHLSDPHLPPPRDSR